MNFEKDKNIVFFDGYCNLCNTTVDLLIKIDSNELLLFAPLSGKTSSDLGILNEFPSSEMSIIYFRNKNDVFNYSDAVIELSSDLFVFGKALLVLKLIPRFIRDAIYLNIARNRYRFFGKKDTCRIPTEQELNRFLD
ncbi:MAG: hypothetical protein CME69_06010 [Halobacteriovorax sp.]|nr:hypothetical protein [Halobacteriovorax sp.]|tara:strand:+ start:101 stop:511 length:411 start_codon:yes stop_codon:yes gene_type:complete